MIFLFDCFGVVVDWKSDHVIPLWAKYAKVSDDDFKRQTVEELNLVETGQISMPELWERVAKKLNIEPSGLEHIFIQCFKQKAKLDDGVVKLIQGLPESYLLSNQMPLAAELCRKNGWFEYFRRVFLSFDVGYMKPDPRSYQVVLKELGVMPHDVVLVDDKKENVDSAIKCGMKGIVYESPAQLKSELEKVYNVKPGKKQYGAA